ncbi:MAG: molybdopterin converting factor subunit 1 [Hyphomicrobiaceae bacterium]|nr:molybdopterin converting factor subunit 1 [Hyphomicrobiaceae bacterium]
MKVRYFAWVREKIGRAEEDVSVPAHVATIADLVEWLKARGPEYAAAFERGEVIRAAVDQSHAPRSARLVGVREVAFFPPVTGG